MAVTHTHNVVNQAAEAAEAELQARQLHLEISASAETIANAGLTINSWVIVVGHVPRRDGHHWLHRPRVLLHVSFMLPSYGRVLQIDVGVLSQRLLLRMLLSKKHHHDQDDTLHHHHHHDHVHEFRSERSLWKGSFATTCQQKHR